MDPFKDQLKQVLLREQYLTLEDFEKASQEQAETREPLGNVLVRLKLINDDTLTCVLSEISGIPLIDLSRLKIDLKVDKFVPKEFAQQHQVIPIALMGETLTLAMADPMNIFVIDNVKMLTGLSVSPVIARVTDIQKTVEKFYNAEMGGASGGETFDKIIEDIRGTEDLELVKDPQRDSSLMVEEITDQAPIIKLTDTIIQQAVLAKASDVFIEPLEHELRVRYRIDGVIREIDRMSKTLHAPIISRIKVIANLDIAEHRLPQDGRFKTIISGDHEVNFRVSVLLTISGEKIVLRVLDQEGGTVLDINKLGFQPTSLERLKECAKKPHGMILACGPTGSGKTTTLYSILKYVDSPEKNIVTVEDPVEYQMRGINQVNVKPAMDLNFPTCLRSILRQDPDIIMIGEIRDAETLDIAVKAALTGHLVITSLHTTTAAGSVVRMVNMGVEPFLICSSVLAIVAQRLLRRICIHCKQPQVISPAVAKQVGITAMFGDEGIEVFHGKGCKKCSNTGYQGRVGITEIFVLSEKIKELIIAGAGELQIKQLARSEGMITMREDGLTKVKEGLTTIEEILRVTAPDNEKTSN